MNDKKTPNTGEKMRITNDELKLLKATFGGNEPLLKIMRKIFLPELDPSMPLGQNIDLWMTINVDNMTPEQAYINIKARNTLINHIEQQLMQIKVLSDIKEETFEELAARMEKDSSK